MSKWLFKKLIAWERNSVQILLSTRWPVSLFSMMSSAKTSQYPWPVTCKQAAIWWYIQTTSAKITLLLHNYSKYWKSISHSYNFIFTNGQFTKMKTCVNSIWLMTHIIVNSQLPIIKTAVKMSCKHASKLWKAISFYAQFLWEYIMPLDKK